MMSSSPGSAVSASKIGYHGTPFYSVSCLVGTFWNWFSSPSFDIINPSCLFAFKFKMLKSLSRRQFSPGHPGGPSLNWRGIAQMHELRSTGKILDRAKILMGTFLFYILLILPGQQPWSLLFSISSCQAKLTHGTSCLLPLSERARRRISLPSG
jgi:hypothetical protein